MKKSVPAVADEARPAVAETPGTVAPQESDRAFLTTGELQRTVLPLSRRSIFEWRKKGIIPSVQVGGKILFHGPSVEAALLRRQTGGVA
jgi:hypothetical protein